MDVASYFVTFTPVTVVWAPARVTPVRSSRAVHKSVNSGCMFLIILWFLTVKYKKEFRKKQYWLIIAGQRCGQWDNYRTNFEDFDAVYRYGYTGYLL